MAGTLAAKARKLELARGLGRVRGERPVQGLVWNSAEVEISRASLREGEFVVTDFTIVELRKGDPSTSVSRDRVTVDPLDYGRVLAWDGRVIGKVLRGSGRRGGVVLEYSWPEGLASTAPASAAAPAARESPAAGELSSTPAAGESSGT